jgi:hypothetical protein
MRIAIKCSLNMAATFLETKAEVIAALTRATRYTADAMLGSDLG